MQQELTLDRLEQMRGAPVYDRAGDKIGKVEEIFYDEDTNRPEWIGIGTGFFGTKRVLVPVAGASASEDGFAVPYDKDQVKDSPDVDSDEISQQTEQELYAWYGLDRSDPEPRGEVRDAGTVTRSEEELRVGKRDVEAGRARLRKRVETEPVQMDVDLHRETARVTREPIEEPASGAEIGEDEVEVRLRAEEPMVSKQTVAKERVGIEKDVEVERRTVADEVRKERVEVEGDEVERR
jgi:uncharacterized protein (TIGR02271 family)